MATSLQLSDVAGCRQLLSAFCSHHFDDAARRKGMDVEDDDIMPDDDQLASPPSRLVALWMPLFNQLTGSVSSGSLDRQELRDRLVVLVSWGLDLERRSNLRVPVSFALILADRVQGEPATLAHVIEGDRHWIEITPAGQAAFGLRGRVEPDTSDDAFDHGM